MTLVRVLRTAQVVLSHTFYVDETATSASGAVTYSIKRLDGTVVASGAATGPAPVGVYQLTVPAQSVVDTLTVDWTGTIPGGGTVTARDIVEVVGGFIFGLAEARAVPPVLDSTRYPSAMLARKRISVEQECEEICGQAFVPRFARAAITVGGLAGGFSMSNTLTLPNVKVRALRAITVDGANQSITGLAVSDSGVITGGAWLARVPASTAIVEYEHGWEYPPEDLREAAMLRLRSRLNQGDTGVPQRALSFSVADGGVYRLSTPSASRTGIPDVDGVYERYAFDRGGFA
jgi:hypothetical protein